MPDGMISMDDPHTDGRLEWSLWNWSEEAIAEMARLIKSSPMFKNVKAEVKTCSTKPVEF